MSDNNNNNNNEVVTPEAIGWAGWTILHTTAAAFPNQPNEQQKKDMRDFIRSWSRVYPCSICAYHMRQQLQVMPPDVSNKRSFSRWTCELHNSVNAMLGKASVDCSPDKVLKRWHPTYPHMEDEPSPEELLAKARQQQQEQEQKFQQHQRQQRQNQQTMNTNSSVQGEQVEDEMSSATHNRWARPAGAMMYGWGAKSDGGGTGVPDSATDVDAVLRRLSSCKAFCPEDKKK